MYVPCFFQAASLRYAGTQIAYMFWCKHSRIIRHVSINV